MPDTSAALYHSASRGPLCGRPRSRGMYQYQVKLLETSLQCYFRDVCVACGRNESKMEVTQPNFAPSRHAKQYLGASEEHGF